MPEDFTHTDHEKRHDTLEKEIIRMDTRIDKVEQSIDAKAAESLKDRADIRREQTESYLKLLEALHSVRDEVAKDRLATLAIEAALKGEIARNTTTQATNSNSNLRWVIGMILTLISGTGMIEVIRLLLTGKP